MERLFVGTDKIIVDANKNAGGSGPGAAGVSGQFLGVADMTTRVYGLLTKGGALMSSR